MHASIILESVQITAIVFHCRQALYIYRRRPYYPLCNQTAILHSTDHKLDFVARGRCCKVRFAKKICR